MCGHTLRAMAALMTAPRRLGRCLSSAVLPFSKCRADDAGPKGEALRRDPPFSASCSTENPFLRQNRVCEAAAAGWPLSPGQGNAGWLRDRVGLTSVLIFFLCAYTGPLLHRRGSALTLTFSIQFSLRDGSSAGTGFRDVFSLASPNQRLRDSGGYVEGRRWSVTIYFASGFSTYAWGLSHRLVR